MARHRGALRSRLRAPRHDAADCILNIGHDVIEKPPFFMGDDERTVIHVNYAGADALLIGWAAQAVQQSVIFSAGDSKYTAAAVDARDVLINTHHWSITDGGQQ